MDSDFYFDRVGLAEGDGSFVALQRWVESGLKLEGPGPNFGPSNTRTALQVSILE